ncbi:MAG: outer membrane beta-barrel protein [Pseudomonadota bacterium]
MFKSAKSVWCIVVLAAPLYGQEQEEQATGLSFTVASEISYDDNVLRQPENQIGSRLWVLNPQLSFIKDSARDAYSVTYSARHNNYIDSPADTFTSQNAALSADKNITESNKIGVIARYDYNYEQRGTGFSQGTGALSLGGPTPMIVKELTGTYQLGSDEAKMRLIGTAGQRSTDRDSALIVNDSRDFKEEMLGGSVLYRVGSRTDLVAEYRERDITYERDPVDSAGRSIALDSTERQHLVGLDLEATAKTTGKLRVGTVERDFLWETAQWDDEPMPVETAADPQLAPAPVNSGQDLYWELAAVWAPRSYSRFELTTRSTTSEAMGVGSYVRSKDYLLSWTHNWKSTIQSRLDFTVGQDVYKDSARVDDRKSASVSMQYELEESLRFGFGYRYQQVESNVANGTFDKSVYYIFANYRRNQGK